MRFGLGVPRGRRTFMGNASGVSRGDRNRNARLERLRALVPVSCEPTGHQWRVLGQLAADRAMPFVCVQPVVTTWSRRTEDLTCDKTDEKDAVSRRCGARLPAVAGRGPACGSCPACSPRSPTAL